MKESIPVGYKKSKKQVTILKYSNATKYHKFMLTLICKPNKLRAFKKLKNKESLSLYYTHEKSLDEFRGL